MPLASLIAPFDHRAWIFDPKYDGFRALGYIDSGQCRLVSRRGTAYIYKSFPQLCPAIGRRFRAKPYWTAKSSILMPKVSRSFTS
jgi:ATP-dependent DNA ligase